MKYTRSAIDDGVTNGQRHATEDPPRKFSYKSEIAFADNFADIRQNENWRRAIREILSGCIATDPQLSLQAIEIK